MAKESIKIGRYSCERRRYHQTLVTNFEKKKLQIPYLPVHTDCQDLIIACNNFYLNLYETRWKDEIADFEGTFKGLVDIFKTGPFPREDYVDVYEVTGLELDNRKLIGIFYESIEKLIFSKIVKGVLALPEIRNMTEAEVIRIFAINKDCVGLALFLMGGMKWNDNNNFTVEMDDQFNFSGKKSDMINLYDPFITDNEITITKKFTKINLNFQEAAMIVAIKILQPNSHFPQFIQGQNRLCLALTRYLESCYGSNYFWRLGEIINLLANYEETISHCKKWVKKNKKYCESIRSLSTSLWLEKDVEKTISLLKSCLI